MHGYNKGNSDPHGRNSPTTARKSRHIDPIGHHPAFQNVPGSTRNVRGTVRGNSKLRSSVGSSGGLLSGFKKVRSDMALDHTDRNQSPDQATRKGTARPRFNVEGDNISDADDS